MTNSCVRKALWAVLLLGAGAALEARTAGHHGDGAARLAPLPSCKKLQELSHTGDLAVLRNLMQLQQAKQRRRNDLSNIVGFLKSAAAGKNISSEERARWRTSRCAAPIGP